MGVKMFVWKSRDDFKYLEIESFATKGSRAYFTSRNGGVSNGHFSSLNQGLHTDDKKEAVIKNRKITAEKLNLDLASFTAAEQVHGNKVHIIQKDDRGRGSRDYLNSISGIDGLITDREDITLFSYYADCVPIYFFDPVKKVIGLAHSGWKGTVKEVAVQVLNKMKDHFQVDLKDCLIGIGPSISRDYYEVDSKVIDKFVSSFSFYKDYVVYKGKGHYLLDLPALNKRIIVSRGIVADNISMSRLCTYQKENDFYSYRRDKGKTGRMASIITL